jgi:RNA polymerase sigma-70 factor (ECF subfamily)
MTNQEKDAEAVKRTRNGDTRAFAEIVERYGRPLLVYISPIVRQRETAEDILQDVLFAAYTNLPSYNRFLGAFSTWIFRIARNRCLNELKRKRVETETDFPELPCDGNPEGDLMKKEVFEALDRAFSSLSFDERSVFVLSEFHGLSHREIAKIEKIQTGTVKSRLSRTKEKLRKALETRLGDGTKP